MVEVGDKGATLKNHYLPQSSVEVGDKVFVLSAFGKDRVFTGIADVGDKVKVLTYNGRKYVLGEESFIATTPIKALYCSFLNTGRIVSINIDTLEDTQVGSIGGVTVERIPYFVRTGNQESIIRKEGEGALRTYYFSPDQCRHWFPTIPFNAGYRSGHADANFLGTVLKIEYIDEDYYNAAKVVKSIDYGLTWTENVLSDMDGTGISGSSHVLSLGGSNWIVSNSKVAENYVYYSNDNGSTWELSTLPPECLNVITAVANNNEGFSFGVSSNIDGSEIIYLESLDNGKTWINVGSRYTPEVDSWAAGGSIFSYINGYFYHKFTTDARIYRSKHLKGWNLVGGRGSVQVFQPDDGLEGKKLLVVGTGVDSWWTSTNNGHDWTLVDDYVIYTYDAIGFPEVYVSNPFIPRQHHGVVRLSTGLRVFGGYYQWYYSGGVLGDVWSSNFGSNWNQIVSMADWGPRYGFGFCKGVTDNIFLTGGGTAFSSPEYKQDTWESTDGGLTWECKSTSAGWGGEEGRCAHQMECLSDGTLLIIGGYCPGPDEVYPNDVWKSTDNGVTWTLVTDDAGFGPRSSFASTVLSTDKVVVMNGYFGYDIDNRYTDVWGSEDAGETWSLLNAAPGWRRRSQNYAVTLPDDSIVMVGGFDQHLVYEAHLGDVWRSTDGGSNWTQLAPEDNWNLHGRGGHKMVALPNGTIILTGGEGFAFDYEEETWASNNYGATWNIICGEEGGAGDL